MRVNDLLKKLDGVFGLLPAARADGYVGEMRRLLLVYEGDALEHASDAVLSDWTDRFRPLPAEFAKRCRAMSQQPNPEDAERLKKLRDATEYRQREYRGYIDRTLERHSVEIGSRGANYADWRDPRSGEISNPYHASVVAVIEMDARLSRWFRIFEQAPHSMEITDETWDRVDEICRRALPMMKRGAISGLLPRASSGAREEIRERAITRAESFDGYQPNA